MAPDEEAPLWRSQIIIPVNVEKYIAKAHLRGADALSPGFGAVFQATNTAGLRNRLFRELESNVALQVDETGEKETDEQWRSQIEPALMRRGGARK